MQAPSAREWWQRPNRVLLINLREGDEPKIDPERLMRRRQSAFGATAFASTAAASSLSIRRHIRGTSGEQRTRRTRSARRNRSARRTQQVCTCSRASIRAVRRRRSREPHPEWFARDRVGNFCEVVGALRHLPECRLLPRAHGRSRARDPDALRCRRHLEQPGQVRGVGHRTVLLRDVP